MGFLLGAKKNIEKRERVIYNGNVTGDIVIDLFNRIKFYINEVNEKSKNDFLEFKKLFIEGMEYDYYYYVYSNGDYESKEFIDYKFGRSYKIMECDDRVDSNGKKSKFILNSKNVDCYTEEFKEVYNLYKRLNKSEANRLIELLKNNIINGYFIVNNEVVTIEKSLYDMIDSKIFDFNKYFSEMDDNRIKEIINNLVGNSTIIRLEENVYDNDEFYCDIFSYLDSFNGFYELFLSKENLKNDFNLNFIMSNNKRLIDFIYKTIVYNTLESYIEFVNSDREELRKAIVEINVVNYFKNNDYARYDSLLNEDQKEIFEYVFNNGFNKLPPSNNKVKEKEYVKRI